VTADQLLARLRCLVRTAAEWVLLLLAWARP
jgi:hypothetical protein